MMVRESLAFVIKAALLLGLMALAVRQTVNGPVWVAAVVIPLLALPTILAGGVGSALRRGHGLRILARDGWLRRLLSGVFFRLAWLSLLSLGLAIVALSRLADAGMRGEAAVLAGAILFWPLFLLMRAGPGAQLAPPFCRVYPVFWARNLAAGLCVVAAFAISLFLPPDPVDLSAPLPSAGSALMCELLGFSHLLAQLQAYALGQVSEFDGWWRLGALVLAALGQFSLAWTVISAVAILVIPAAEFRRAFAPPSDEAAAPRLGAATIAWTSFATTLFLLFIWLPELATWDATLRAQADLQGQARGEQGTDNRPATVYAEEVQKRIIEVERLGRDFFRPGTVKQHDELLREYGLDAARQEQLLIDAINEGADRMIANVDPFLDGYYSLWGEYTRLFAMLTGSFEDEITRKLTESLDRDNPFGKYNRLMSDGLKDEGSRTAEVIEKLATLLDRMQIPPEELEGAEIRVTATRPDPFARFTPVYQQLKTRMDNRVRLSGRSMAIGGALGGVIGAVVVKKVATKGAVKLAAKAVTKVAASKVAGGGLGAAGGAALGGTIGSVVPGLGTAIGAAIGGIVGAVAGGVAVDAVLLELEEHFSRAEFRSQIVAAIKDQRDEMIGEVRESFRQPEAAAQP